MKAYTFKSVTRTGVSALLLVMALLLILTGCNTPTPSEGPTEKPTEQQTEPTVPPVEDREPYTVLVRPDGDGRIYRSVVMEDASADADAVARSIYERTTFIEDTFAIDFELDIAADGNADLIRKVEEYARTGTDRIEVISCPAREVAWELAISGAFYDWNTLDSVRLEADYWHQDAKEEFSTPGGNLFFMSGDLSHLPLASATCMFVNKSLVSKHSWLVTSPFELFQEGRWTFDVFMEYLIAVYDRLDSDGSGSVDTDRWGYVTTRDRGFYQSLVSSYRHTLEKANTPNAIGGYKVNLTREIFDNLIDDFYALSRKNVSRVFEAEDANQPRFVFEKKRAIFYDGELSYAKELRDAGINLGVLPWPKYCYDDEMSDCYNSLVNGDIDVYAIPVNTSARHAGEIGAVLDALASAGAEKVIPLYLEDLFTKKDSTVDEESVAMAELIHRGLNFDFGFYYNPGGDFFSLNFRNPDPIIVDLERWGAVGGK